MQRAIPLSPTSKQQQWQQQQHQQAEAEASPNPAARVRGLSSDETYMSALEEKSDPSDVHASATVSVAPSTTKPTLKERFANFFHYETVRIVRIRNRKVFCLNLFFQLVILTYILVFGLYLRKGYQKTDQATGSANLKVQGIAYSNSTLPWYGPDSPPVFQVYDALDLQTPPLESDSAFVTTNWWVTLNQTRGTCVSFDNKTNSCATANCSSMYMTPAGRQIGGEDTCMTDYVDPQQKWPTGPGSFCMLYAWCPTENEITSKKLNHFHLQGVKNFTIFARINIHYPTFHKHLDNSGGISNVTNGLNVWTIEQMVEAAGYKWNQVNQTGMLLAMNSRWDCDFDQYSSCDPVIEFIRLDDPNSHLSSGYNFRTVEFLHDSYGARELTKHYGIRLILIFEGIGSQADIVAALTSIGAGIGLLSIAGLIADFVSTKFLSKKIEINSAKYDEVQIEDPKLSLEFDQLVGSMRKLTSKKKKKRKDSAASGSEPQSRKRTLEDNSTIQRQAGDRLNEPLIKSTDQISMQL